MKTLILLFLLFIISTCLFSTIINVPADQPTIQAGIEAAAETDTVLVAEGTYFENIDFMENAITVASNFIIDADPLHIENTIINGSQPDDPDFGSCVMFLSGEDTTSVIIGFTLTEGTGCFRPAINANAGGGIACVGSSPKIVSNIVTNNSAYFAGGIGAQNDSSPIILNNVISYNTGFGGNAAMSLIFGGNAYLEGNIISHNTSNVHCGGIMISDSSPILVDNIISDNTALNDVAGGIIIQDNSSPLLRNNTIYNNTAATYGGGIWIFNSTPTIANCSIYDNSTAFDGGGIFINNSSPTLSDNVIADNSTDLRGGGVFVTGDSSPVFSNNIICDNTAGTHSGGLTFTSCLATTPGIVENCQIYGNTANGNCGGLGVYDSDIKVINCIISDNHSGGNGGGVFVLINANANIINCTISGNTSSLGGGIAVMSSDITMINAIVEGNDALFGAGINFDQPGNVDISFSDFFNDEPNFGGSVPTGLGDITSVNANNDPCDEFMNVFLDPLFLDPANDDFHLTENSPCINAGDPLSPLDPDGTIVDIGRFYFEQVGTEDNTVVQTTDYLQQNYPNPFNPETTISYQLPKNGEVELVVYNLKGQKVKQLISDQLSAGQHSAIWNGRDNNGKSVSSGIYFYKLNTENYEKTKRMVLMK